MIEIGKFNKLNVSKVVDFGIYLEAKYKGENTNILLPKNQLEKEYNVGESLDVFIYRDSSDRLIATFKKPYALVGEIAYLKVVSNTNIGSFLDWGLEKDLFLPFKEQRYKVKEGKKYPVALYLDNADRICATTQIYDFLLSDSTYVKNDKVIGTVYAIDEEIGVFVAVDNKYFGLIPKNEYFEKIEIGDILTLRVIRVREDGKLDLSPRELSYMQINNDADKILNELKEKRFIPLNDKSDPKLIKQRFNLSKASFKKAIGRLFKENLIDISDKGIHLRD